MLSKSQKGYRAKANSERKRILQKVLFTAVLLTLFALIPVVYINLQNGGGNELRSLRESFEAGAFEISHERSREMLEEDPLDFFLLTIHGFSSYHLGRAQINSFDALSYIDDSIWSLRKALLVRENSPEVFYVLGKAYYYKDDSYADLSVKYLERAQNSAFQAADIPEYLGLAHAALSDYRSSIEAFSLALNGRESDESYSEDMLLLAIANSYLALGEHESASVYLIRCIEVSRDSNVVSSARLLLAGALLESGDLDSAEEEYLSILQENGENASAYFKLGEIYLIRGNATRARAEWRRALRVDPAYRPARDRLNLL